MIQKLKEELKLLFMTKLGLLSWFIANIITSLHWAIPFAFGVILKNGSLLAFSATAFAIGMTPFVPLWLFNIIIAGFINRKIFKNQNSR